jgi:hypothetical protein
MKWINKNKILNQKEHKKHHIIISGTGRAGTTFLVQLLTSLGLDTGYETPYTEFYTDCNAGMEKDIRAPEAPYIIKSPWVCDYIDEILANKDIVIDHAIIPVRDIYSAAESRRIVSKRTENQGLPIDEIRGGLWHTTIPENQEEVLASQFYNLVYFLILYDIPITFLHFPRIANDPVYLFGKLKRVFRITKKNNFIRIFDKISRPNLIHDFEKQE